MDQLPLARWTDMTSEMGWENWYLRFILLLSLVVADLCPEPVIPNGEVRGEKGENLFFGEITCNIGYHLVGASKTIKCRHGVWSHKELPVCSAVGICPTLPTLKNGRNVPIQGSRGSAYRFKCNRGFKRFGELRTHCIGHEWSHENMPTCAKASCDQSGMLDIPYGEGRAILKGAVYKYRCNIGVEMEGSDILVCDGERWNGSVPHCNVKPTDPLLEVTVSGNAVTSVKPGDWVLVTCQASGGHPVADIGITLDGVQATNEDFKNLNNSFTFAASEEDNEKTILCTAVNKVGTAAVSTVLHVHAPPTTATISGPKTVHHEDEFTYECSVEGGDPEPEISWSVSDHLGGIMQVEGEMMGAGLARIILKTGTKERKITIHCQAENDQGSVTNTMHVHTHYHPKSLQITGPTSALPGDYAHLTCLTTETFPVPELKWKIEKSGEFYAIDEVDADVSSDALEDGGVVAYAKTDILMEGGFNNALVQCVAVVNDQEKVMSDKHKIDIITIEALEEEVETKEDLQSYQYEQQDDKTPEDDHSLGTAFQLVKLEKTHDIKEQERSRELWIPLDPVDNIDDYQEMFHVDYNKVHEENENQEPFQRPSALPEAPMLKQEKEYKSQSIETAAPVAMVFSSSSTIFSPSLFLAVILSISILLH